MWISFPEQCQIQISTRSELAACLPISPFIPFSDKNGIQLPEYIQGAYTGPLKVKCTHLMGNECVEFSKRAVSYKKAQTLLSADRDEVYFAWLAAIVVKATDTEWIETQGPWCAEPCCASEPLRPSEREGKSINCLEDEECFTLLLTSTRKANTQVRSL